MLVILFSILFVLIPNIRFAFFVTLHGFDLVIGLFPHNPNIFFLIAIASSDSISINYK